MNKEVLDFLLGLFSAFKVMKTSTVNKKLREAGFEDIDARKYLRYLRRNGRLEKHYTKDVYGTIELEWKYIE